MIALDGRSLTLEQFDAIAEHGAQVKLPDAARSRIAAGREAIEALVASGEVVYGVNTGFGDLASVRIPRDQLEVLQERLILSHAAGVGEALPPEVVRGMLALRANTLARGHSGVRVEVVEVLLELLNAGLLPCVPSRGSVGASGDLAPLAHLALAVLGRGTVRDGANAITGAEALARIGREPMRLAAKEGLALINGTQAMTSLLALGAIRARRLLRAADAVAAMSVDALRGTDAAFDPRLHALRPHPGQQRSADNLWRLLRDSQIRESHRHGDVRVQDPYSLRCTPQVHGAARDVLDDVRVKVEREMNSVTDNPLVFPDEGDVVSGGNFHGEPMAIAADVLGIAMAEIAAISERRIEKLTNTAFSGLPPFLTADAGLNSGFMIAQVTAAALSSESKTLAHPASVDSIPTSADKEDHVSMGMGAALKLHTLLDNTRQVLGIELVAAAQGIDLLRPLRSSSGIERVHAMVRERVEPWTEDREMAPVLAAGLEMISGIDPVLDGLGID